MSSAYLTFSGTPYEQGLSHGEALKGSIKNNISVYLDRFEMEAGIKHKKLLKNAGIYLKILSEQSPEYVDGMNGIAESSNTDIVKIAMLNLRYELLYDALGKRYLDETVDGCTSFAMLPEATHNNHLIMGQNWDWIPDVDCTLTLSKDVDGLQRLSYIEAGIFAGKPGMNSEGIGLTVNGMYSTDDDWARFKKPFHLRCYEALRSRHMEEVLESLIGTPRSCTANFIVGHAPDKVVDVELAPDMLRIIDPKNGVLSHANHFSNPDVLGVSEPPNPRRHFSEFRQKRMKTLLNTQKPLDIPNIQTILRDHKNNPQSLCRHQDNTLPESQHTITKTAMIMDLEEKKMWVTNGQPCVEKFEEYYIN